MIRRLVISVVAAGLAVGVLAAPADAKDSGWGCGGACRVIRH